MWLYLERLSEYVSQAKAYTQQQIAKECHIAPTTVSEWRRDPRFREELRRVIHESNAPEAELAIRAMLRMAQRGSVKAFEAAMRALGRFDNDLPGEPPPGSETSVKVGVAFYGLPMPPTPQQAQAMRPPAGSAMVVTAAGVLEDRGRK